MPSTKPILNFYIDEEQLDGVDELWRGHKFATRVETVRWLIQTAPDKKLAPKAEGKGRE